MKEYIDQIFYEGLGKSIYVPLENEIGKIKKESVVKYLTYICKVICVIIYEVIVLLL